MTFSKHLLSYCISLINQLKIDLNKEIDPVEIKQKEKKISRLIVLELKIRIKITTERFLAAIL
tara:strand:+ start:757 stop:945 length:189 start_codon:yes stop_codon:yes gene_type:complete